MLGALTALALLVPATARRRAQVVAAEDRRGSQVSISQYPWQAAVVVSPGKMSGNAHQRQFCGGSLVTSRIVITAAHCVVDTIPIASASPRPAAQGDPGGDGTTRSIPTMSMSCSAARRSPTPARERRSPSRRSPIGRTSAAATRARSAAVRRRLPGARLPVRSAHDPDRGRDRGRPVGAESTRDDHRVGCTVPAGRPGAARPRHVDTCRRLRCRSSPTRPATRDYPG